MIKKQQKWIALLVTLTFMGLLQVSTMPCAAAAAGTAEQIRAANAEQGPRYIEEEGDGGFVAKKKSILPIILIGVGVVAVAAVLFLVVLKTSYDITGTWDFNFNSASPALTWTWNLVFSGDKKSGTFVDAGDTGTYTVDDKNVSIQYDDWEIRLTGVFDSKDKISGTATFAHLTIYSLAITSATFTAVRSGTTAAITKPLAGKEKTVR
jgi:hypothetical protein